MPVVPVPMTVPLRLACGDSTAAREAPAMAPVPKAGTVAVTGAAGFIGGHVVQDLLARGYRVRACVRDVDDDRKVGFLKAMNPYASGRLTLHPADLDQPGCFDDVFRGCDGVAHVSHVSTYDDPDYVRRTCDHIIASVESSGSVRRVVVTSSLAAIISEADINELARRPIVDEDREPDESNPKRTPERGQGYSMGKVIAQHAFADAAAATAGGMRSPCARPTTWAPSCRRTTRTAARGSTSSSAWWRDAARSSRAPARTDRG